MESPDVYILSQVRWQFFGTLTFKSERLPERVRLAMYFALMRRIASKFRVHFRRLPWCLRQERGELFGRRHFHYLLTGLPRMNVTQTTCFYMMATWERLGGGMARVRRFDHRLSGVDYVAGCLNGSTLGEDGYESAKFGDRSSELMLSDGLQRILRSITMRTERHFAHRKIGG